jgi:hypothetical protein
MAAIYKGSKDGTHQVLEKVLLYNSLTLEIGDLVETATYGYGNVSAAGAIALGFIVGFCDKNGQPLETGRTTAGTAKSPSVTTVTTAATNTTTQTYWAWVDTSKSSKYSISVSGTLGTTNASNLRGCRIDINSAGAEYGQVLETTATRTAATDANLYSYGLDPEDSTRLIVSIALSETDPSSP